MRTSFFKYYDFNWTKYSVSFLTEAMNFDTPKDSSSPIGLDWYTTEKKMTNHALNSLKIQAIVLSSILHVAYIKDLSLIVINYFI